MADRPPELARMSWYGGVRCAINDGGMAHRVDAAGRLRQAAAALSPLRIAILEALVLRDCAWTELARLLRLSDKTPA
jgi:hypothetical protein